MRTRASRTGPLAACLLIVALPSALHAQQATTAGPAPEEPTGPPPATTERPQATENITVSPARLPELLPSSRVPASVEVIKGEQAETPGAATVAESLERHVGGLTLLDEQGNSYQPDLSLRGFQGTSVAGVPQGLSVFLDGIRINEPTAEELNFDLLPNEDLDRIEVIRGPSVVFGRNTLAGVVNLTTRRGKPDGVLAAQVAVGSYGQQKYQLQLSGAKAPFDYYFSGTDTREDGWRESSQARLSRAFGKLGYLKGGTDLTLSYQYAENRISQAGSLPPNELSEHRNSNFSPGDFFEPLRQTRRVDRQRTAVSEGVHCRVDRVRQSACLPNLLKKTRTQSSAQRGVENFSRNRFICDLLERSRVVPLQTTVYCSQ